MLETMKDKVTEAAQTATDTVTSAASAVLPSRDQDRDRPARQDRGDRRGGDRMDRGGRGDRGDRFDRNDRGDRGERFDRGDRGDRGDRRTFNTPTPSKSIYVGNLFFETQEADLQHEFSKHGSVAQVRLAQDNQGLSKG